MARIDDELKSKLLDYNQLKSSLAQVRVLLMTAGHIGAQRSAWLRAVARVM